MIVKRGYCKGMEIAIEGEMGDVMHSTQLSHLEGVPAVMQAMNQGAYTQDDEPFYYGKIGRLGYLISHGDLHGG